MWLNWDWPQHAQHAWNSKPTYRGSQKQWSVVLYKILQRYFHVAEKSRGNRISSKGDSAAGLPSRRQKQTLSFCLFFNARTKGRFHMQGPLKQTGTVPLRDQVICFWWDAEGQCLRGWLQNSLGWQDSHSCWGWSDFQFGIITLGHSVGGVECLLYTDLLLRGFFKAEC